jgi:dihydropteroate synthase
MNRVEAFNTLMKRAVSLRGAALLGVCNVTPDSFSDGGDTLALDAAVAHASALLMHGADIIDVGGESTRPGAAAVPPEEQLRRILDVVRVVAKTAFTSVDTTSPEVAEACLLAGAHAINDVSCARDPELARVAAKHGAVYMLMHARGTQAEMRGFGGVEQNAYDDVVTDVVREWHSAESKLLLLGVAKEAIVFDPGYGFAKNAAHSLELLRRTSELRARVNAPLLSGASRKSFLKFADPDATPKERVGASIAAACYAVQHGATLVRVHDVRATQQALRVDAALRGVATC